MQLDGQKIWGVVLSSIKTKLSASLFKTWFSGSVVVDFNLKENKGFLRIGLKNNFIKEQVQTRYLQIIKNVLSEKGFGNVEVVFTVIKTAESEKKEATPLFSGVAPSMLTRSRSDALSLGYSFESFVVGSSNQVACLASKQAVENLGKVYNPILVYGPTGVGKTHLLHAIGNAASQKYADIKILYLTSERFMNDYIESINTRTTTLFRKKYRSCDILLVDDVHFLAGKESTQDEFFHTFNELALSQKQIVLACDRHPQELSRLKERLASRFLGGIAASISYPDIEMKISIIKRKCAERAVSLDEDVISYIASSCTGGVRELEGILALALAQIKITGGKVGLHGVKAMVENNKRYSSSKTTVEKIFSAVSNHFNVTENKIKSSSRRSRVVLARQVLMFLLRTELGLSLGVIGDYAGGRDHSTVLYSICKVEKIIVNNSAFKDDVLRVKGAAAN